MTLERGSTGAELISSDRRFGAPVLDRPAVSVVVATYNRVDGLVGLLHDLDSQRLSDPFDVIVVDDGGTVDVASALEALPAQSFPLRFLRRTNGGPGPARDTGIRAATGDIIVILDDDMTVEPGFVAAHVAAHRRGAEVALGNIVAPRDAALPLFEQFHIDGIERTSAKFLRGELPEGTNLCTGNVSFRRSAYLAVGGFDLTLRRCEDRDLGIRFEQAGYTFGFCADGRSEHRTDHQDVGTWRRRSRLFGALDQRIASKHPGLAKVSPWAFLPLLPAVVRPVLVVAAAVPRIGGWAASAAYRVGSILQQRGLRSPALRFASTTYALEYFSGVGEEVRRSNGAFTVLSSMRSTQKKLRRQTGNRVAA